MSQDDPTKPVEAQISEHMVVTLANEPFVDDIRYIPETQRQNLTDEHGTAVRTYIPEYALEDCTKPRISVIHYGRTQERWTRATMREIYTIDAVVTMRLIDPHREMKTLPSDDVAERERKWKDLITVYGDHISRLAEQVAHVFEHPTFMATAVSIANCQDQICAYWMRCERDELYNRAQIAEKHVLFSITRHIWHLYRPWVRHA